MTTPDLSDLRPEKPDYPKALRHIRESLDAGLTVFAVHNEFVTRKELLLSPKAGWIKYGQPYGTSGEGWLHVVWMEHGSCWASMTNWMDWMDWTYIAQKMAITKWPGDAKSIAALVQNIAQIGTGKALVTADSL